MKCVHCSDITDYCIVITLCFKDITVYYEVCTLYRYYRLLYNMQLLLYILKILQCTVKWVHCTDITLLCRYYCTVLQRYYSVLQKYYKILLRYYSYLKSITSYIVLNRYYFPRAGHNLTQCSVLCHLTTKNSILILQAEICCILASHSCRLAVLSVVTDDKKLSRAQLCLFIFVQILQDKIILYRHAIIYST